MKTICASIVKSAVLLSHKLNVSITKTLSQLDARVKCDASSSELCAALKENAPDGWKPNTIASRFLNTTEERYSVKGWKYWE